MPDMWERAWTARGCGGRDPGGGVGPDRPDPGRRRARRPRRGLPRGTVSDLVGGGRRRGTGPARRAPVRAGVSVPAGDADRGKRGWSPRPDRSSGGDGRPSRWWTGRPTIPAPVCSPSGWSRSCVRCWSQPEGRVVCILNRTGRIRLLACARCGTLARCTRCGGAMAQSEAGGGLRVPAVRGHPSRRSARCATRTASSRSGWG